MYYNDNKQIKNKIKENKKFEKYTYKYGINLVICNYIIFKSIKRIW